MLGHVTTHATGGSVAKTIWTARDGKATLDYSTTATMLQCCGTITDPYQVSSVQKVINYFLFLCVTIMIYPPIKVIFT